MPPPYLTRSSCKPSKCSAPESHPRCVKKWRTHGDPTRHRARRGSARLARRGRPRHERPWRPEAARLVRRVRPRGDRRGLRTARLPSGPRVRGIRLTRGDPGRSSHRARPPRPRRPGADANRHDRRRRHGALGERIFRDDQRHRAAAPLRDGRSRARAHRAGPLLARCAARPGGAVVAGLRGRRVGRRRHRRHRQSRGAPSWRGNRNRTTRRVAMTLRHEMAWLALLIGSIVNVRAANANAHTVPGHPRSARDSAARDEMYAAVPAYVAAERIPAFARKYGMKCSACHLAVPVLNAYGQAFKDNGYRMKNGTDDLRANEPGYWPVFAWLWKNYEYDVERVGGQTVQRLGRVRDGALVFGGMGSISDKVSFRFLPSVYEDGFTFTDAGWIRYNQAFGTDWVNIKLGSNEFDLPINGGREYNMSNSRFAVLYAYAVPGTVSRFAMLFPQPGIEVMGHDLGSRNRYSVNVFTAGGAPAGHCTFCSPGVCGRVTHRHEFANGFLRSVRAGVFGAYVTWPAGPDSSDRKGQRRLGGDVEFGLGSDVLPLRVTLMAMTGRDDRALVPTAIQDPTFHAGLLQLEYVPRLPLVFYSRRQVVRNQRQAIAGRPADFGDQDFQLVGVRRALALTSRFAWGW